MSFSITTVLNYQKATGGGNPNPEMLTNGTFDSTSSWTTGAGWSISGGTLNNADTNSFQNVIQYAGGMVSSIATSTNYTIEFDLTIVSGNAHLGFTNANDENLVDAAYYANGHITINFTSPASLADGGFSIYNMNLSDGAYSIDNLSLKLA
jgi:hypothetical protein